MGETAFRLAPLHIRGARRAGVVVAAALVAAGLFPSVIAPHVAAVSVQPFAPRFTANDNGAIALFGNNLMTCRATGTTATTCPNARAGIGSSLNNNNYFMINLDQDGSAFATFNSSSADISIPSGESVLFAGLYWGARAAKGAGTGAADAPLARDQMKLRGPGDATYRTIATQDVFGPTSTSDKAYQQFANVTSILRALGQGTYWGADVAAATGEDRYAGWAMVVVYRDPSLPLRNLTVFDGMTDVGSNEQEEITISGFLAPLSGTVDTQLGMIAYEGDMGSPGDAAFVVQPRVGPDLETRLATDLSPGTNFFNSSNDRNGTLVTDRSPADRNMLGFDIMQLGAPGAVDNGSREFRVKLTTNADRYYAGVVTTSINLYSPDFTTSTKNVVNLAGNDPARPGDILEYTLTYPNTGQDPASQVVASDPLPPGVTYELGSIEILTGPNSGPKTDASDADQAEFLAASRTVRVRLGVGAGAAAGGVLSVGATTSFRFRVAVEPVAAPSTVENRATLAYRAQTIDAPFTYVGNPATTSIEPVADLSLTKTTAPDPAIAGQVVTSTLTVRNSGPSPASDVVVDDLLPPGLALVSAAASVGSCSGADPVSCNLGSLGVGATATVTVVARIPTGSTETAVTNQATVSSSTPDPDPSDNSTGATAGVTTSADLSVVKTATVSSAAPGEVVEFEIAVANAGPSDARNVTLTDSLAPMEIVDATAPPGATCSVSGGGFQCTADVVPAGATLTGTVQARIPVDFVASTVSNSASVVSSTPDPNAANDSDTSTVIVEPPSADLTVSKQSDAADRVTGQEVTFVITVANEGPSLARSVTLADALPAGLEPVSASTSRGSCTVAATITCDIGELEPGGWGVPGPTATVSIVARVGPTASGTITNTATVDSTAADPDPGTNTDSASVAVTAIADVEVEKVAAPNPVVPGAPLTYTVTVTNNGPALASGVGFEDRLPSEFVLAAVPSGCVLPEPTLLSCEFGNLAVGASTPVLITMNVPLNVPDVPIENTVTVNSDSADPVDANDQATATTTAGPLADVSVTKVADPAVPVAGTEVTYTIAVSNAGPSVAAAVDLVDVLPAGTTLVSAPDCTGGTPNLTCDLGDLAPGAITEVVVTVLVDAALEPGTALRNTASAASTTTDPSDSNNTATASGDVTAAADIQAIKTVDPTTAGPGDTVNYFVAVVNSGPSVARNVTLVDVVGVPLDPTAVPPGCTLVAGSIECFFAEMVPDLGIFFELPLLLPSSLPPGPFQNVALVGSTTTDPTPDDHEATATVTVTDPVVDLVIEKTSPAAQLILGTEFSFEISVRADSGADAQDVEVADTLPAGFVPESATSSQGTCEVLGQTVTCDLGTVRGPAAPDPPPPVVIVVRGTVASSAPTGTMENTAAVRSLTDESDPTDNASTIAVPVIRYADMSITKIPDATEVAAGSPLGFNLVVSNAGPVDAVDVIASDLLPAGVIFDPDTSDSVCTSFVIELGVVVNCPVGTVPVGETRIARIGTRLEPGLAAGEVVNRSFVGSLETGDPFFEDNEDAATITVAQASDLVATKVADTASVLVGDDVTFTATVTNAGPSTATDVVLADELPPGTTLVTATGASGLICSPAGAGVECTIPTLEPGSSASAEIVVTIPDGSAPGEYMNVARASSAVSDPNEDDNEAVATVMAEIHADVAITKEALTDPIVVGQPATYRFTVTNAGPSDAPDVLVIDPLPAGTTFRSAVPSQGSCASTVVEGIEVGECHLGLLRVGETATVEFTIDTSVGLEVPLPNEAIVGAAALDPVNLDNTSRVLTPVVIPADLSINKAGAAVIAAGGTAGYELTFANMGPGLATDVVVTDTLPNGLTLATAPAGCTSSGQTVTCTVGPVLAGEGGTIELTVGVDPGLADGTSVTNTASIDGAQLDNGQGNDSATVASTVGRAVDVSVDVVADRDTTTPGGQAGFSVSVTNNGPIAASQGELVVELPPQLHAIAVTGLAPATASLDAAVVVAAIDPATDCTVSGTTVTCAIGDLAVGETVGIVATGTINQSAQPGSSLVASATVTVAEPDTVPANDSSSDAIVVVALGPSPTPTVAPTPTIPPTTMQLGPFTLPGNVGGLATVLALMIMVGAGIVAGIWTALRRRRGQRRPA